MIDLDTVTVKRVCQTPRFKNDVESNNFHLDVTNMTSPTVLTRRNLNNDMSLSLLSLAPKTTIDVLNKDDPHGQYLRFVVTGNRNTDSLSFHVAGKMVPEI